jgi:uncharacterized RDD family membrane protein YckC
MENQNYSTTAAPSNDLFQDEPLIYAGFGDRFGAAFIDGLILLVPNLALTYSMDAESYGPNIIAIILAWLYFAFQESSAAQATLGKKVLGIKVVSLEGQRISFAQASGRHFGKITIKWRERLW